MSDHHSTTLRSWNAAAQLYEERFMHFSLYDEGYDALLAGLAADARVLEIGCGPGMITAYLLGKRPDLRCLATDAAPAMVALAAKNCPAAETRLLDARDIASLLPGYDAIVAGFVLPYLSEEETVRLLQETASLLHPGGFLYLSFMPGDPAASGWQTGGSGHRMYFRYFDEAIVGKWLREAGFRLLREWALPYGAEDVHCVRICRREFSVE